MNAKTPAQLAEELGISRTMVGHVIHGRARSVTVETRISEVVGLPIEVLWPEVGKKVIRRKKRGEPALGNA